MKYVTHETFICAGLLLLSQSRAVPAQSIFAQKPPATLPETGHAVFTPHAKALRETFLQAPIGRAIVSIPGQSGPTARAMPVMIPGRPAQLRWTPDRREEPIITPPVRGIPK